MFNGMLSEKARSEDIPIGWNLIKESSKRIIESGEKNKWVGEGKRPKKQKGCFWFCVSDLMNQTLRASIIKS